MDYVVSAILYIIAVVRIGFGNETRSYLLVCTVSSVVAIKHSPVIVLIAIN